MSLKTVNAGGKFPFAGGTSKGIGTTNTKYGQYSSGQTPQIDPKTYQLRKNQNSFVKLLAVMGMKNAARVAGKSGFAVGSARKNCKNAKSVWRMEDRGTPITWIKTAPTPAGGEGAGTQITVETGDGRMFKPRDQVYDVQTKEVFIVEKVEGDVLTVTRNIGNGIGAAPDMTGTGKPEPPDYTQKGDRLVLAGSAFYEGSGPATPMTFGYGEDYNYCQIFKFAVGNTNTNEATEYDGNIGKLENQKAKAIEEFFLSKSRAYYIGKRYLNENIGPTATDFGQANPYDYNLNGHEPLRTTGGLDFFIQSNIMEESAANFNYGTIIDFLEQVHEYDDDERLFLVSPSFYLVLQKSLAGVLNSNSKPFSGITFTESPKASEYGLNIQKITTAFGDMSFMVDKALSYLLPKDQGVAYALNMSEIEELVLREDQWEENIQLPGWDRQVSQFLCETGLKVVNEKHHAKLLITGITGYNPRIYY